MKIKSVVLMAVSCFGLSTNLAAQTCASPLPIPGGIPSGMLLSGDTCGAANSLASYGAIPSPQNEVVYSFVAVAANNTFTISPNAFGGFIALMPSPCTDTTDIIAAGNSGSPMPATGLVDGATYYFIVTADPGGPSAACGAYTVTRSGVPVELQSFSIE